MEVPLFHFRDNLVRAAHTYKTPVDPIYVESFSPALRPGLSAESVKIRASISDHVHSQHFLPMPVHFSPILVILKSPLPSKRVTDSVASITLMHQILQAYGGANVMHPYYRQHRKHISGIMEKFKDDMKVLEVQLWVELGKLMQKDDISKEIRLSDFIGIMERFTIRRIHVYEEALEGLFPSAFPKGLRTQFEAPPATEDMQLLLEHFLLTKEALRNKDLKDQGHAEVREFDFSKIDEAPRYKNYLSREIAWQYLKFSDANNRVN